jgi:hypothetical protein
MSATMPAPPTVDPPTDTATQPASLRVVAVPERRPTEPAAPSSRVSHPRRSSGQLGEALTFTAWASGPMVASVVGAVALAIATPYVIGRVLYDERKYR